MFKLAIGVVLGVVLAATYPQQTRLAGTAIVGWINSAATATAEATREPNTLDTITTELLEPLSRDK